MKKKERERKRRERGKEVGKEERKTKIPNQIEFKTLLLKKKTKLFQVSPLVMGEQKKKCYIGHYVYAHLENSILHILR